MSTSRRGRVDRIITKLAAKHTATVVPCLRAHSFVEPGEVFYIVECTVCGPLLDDCTSIKRLAENNAATHRSDITAGARDAWRALRGAA